MTKQVENRLQTSLDNIIEGYQIIDYDWRYAYINESAAKQGRRTKSELQGKTMMQAYPGIDQTQMFNHLRNCMTNRVSHKMENAFTFPDGSKGWFELRIEPVPEGILILSLDVTKNKENEAEKDEYRRRLERVVAERTAEHSRANEKLKFESQELLKAEAGLNLRAEILDNAEEAIFLLNTKGDFAYANKAACKIYGYTLKEFLSLNLQHLQRPEEQAAARSHLKKVTEKGQLKLQTVHLSKDKKPMHIQLQLSLIDTQHGQFIVGEVCNATT
jgi:PAS domain S-box-containing protein